MLPLSRLRTRPPVLWRPHPITPATRPLISPRLARYVSIFLFVCLFFFFFFCNTYLLSDPTHTTTTSSSPMASSTADNQAKQLADDGKISKTQNYFVYSITFYHTRGFGIAIATRIEWKCTGCCCSCSCTCRSSNGISFCFVIRTKKKTLNNHCFRRDHVLPVKVQLIHIDHVLCVNCVLLRMFFVLNNLIVF